MNKRIIAVFISAIFVVLSFCSCGKSGNNNDIANMTENSSTESVVKEIESEKTDDLISESDNQISESENVTDSKTTLKNTTTIVKSTTTAKKTSTTVKQTTTAKKTTTTAKPTTTKKTTTTAKPTTTKKTTTTTKPTTTKKTTTTAKPTTTKKTTTTTKPTTTKKTTTTTKPTTTKKTTTTTKPTTTKKTTTTTKPTTTKANRTITVNKSSVQLEKGSNTIVNVTAHNATGNYSISYDKGNNPNIISCSWGNWNGDTAPLTITANVLGTTQIKIYFSDEPSKIMAIINVTVVNNTSGTATATYNGLTYKASAESLPKTVGNPKASNPDSVKIISATPSFTYYPSYGEVWMNVETKGQIINSGSTNNVSFHIYLCDTKGNIIYSKIISLNGVNGAYSTKNTSFVVEPGTYVIKFADYK